MEPFGRLVALCPPPQDLPRVEAVAAVDSGLRIPPSYSKVIGRYGPGRLDDFLAIYSLNCPNKYLDISYWTEISAGIMAGAAVPDLRAALAEFGPRPEDLIQWGGTDNADSLFWIPTGESNEWPTVIVEAGQLDFMVVREDSLDVILGLVSGSLRCQFFPEDFPDANSEFVRAV